MSSRGAFVALLCLLGRPAVAGGPIAVVPLDEDPATARLTAVVRHRLQQEGRELRDTPRPGTEGSSAARKLAAEVEERTKAALALYDNMEFGQARQTLRQALKLCRAWMQKGGGSVGAEYLRILHYLAAASHFDGDRDETRRSFAEAIAYTPGKTPDAAIFPPDVLAVFKKVRAASRKGSVQLKVVTRPVSSLELDGRQAGNSPVEWPALGPGHHLLVIRRSGQPVQARWLVLQRGKPMTLSLDVPSAEDPVQGLLRPAAVELEGTEPGLATTGIMHVLSVKELLLISAGGGQARLGWAEEGRGWVKRHRGPMVEGGERAFADIFFEAQDRLANPPPPDCSAGGPGCPVQPAPSTAIYRRWWFWTLIAVAAGGAGVGIYFGVRAQHPQWRAEVAPSESQ